MNKQNSRFHATLKESPLLSKAKPIQIKSPSISSPKTIIAQTIPDHTKMISFNWETTNAIIKDDQIEDSNEIGKLLDINNDGSIDSMTEDLLEIEGKRILDNLTENIYETTKGDFIINAKRIIQNKSNSTTSRLNHTRTNTNSTINEIIIQMHQKHKSCAEGFNSLILNTTKETESKASHQSNNVTLSPIARNKDVNLYKDFNKKSGLKELRHYKGNNNFKYDKDLDDNDLLSFVSKITTKSKETKSSYKSKPKPKQILSSRQKQPKVVIPNNKCTNISLLSVPNEKTIKSFFNNKIKKDNHLPFKPRVFEDNGINHCLSNNNNNKNSKTIQKKMTKQSDDGCLTKTDYSYKQNSDITQEDLINLKLYTSITNRGLSGDFVNI